jgi:hypothetical protein
MADRRTVETELLALLATLYIEHAIIVEKYPTNAHVRDVLKQKKGALSAAIMRLLLVTNVIE